MLRGSGRHHGTDYSFEGIVHGDGGSGVEHEAALLDFADAVIADMTSLGQARAALVEQAGKEAMIDAAAVVAGFDAITRVADGTGIPLEQPKAEASASWRSSLGIDAFWTGKI
jgi:hypothetical protein